MLFRWYQLDIGTQSVVLSLVSLRLVIAFDFEVENRTCSQSKHRTAWCIVLEAAECVTKNVTPSAYNRNGTNSLALPICNPDSLRPPKVWGVVDRLHSTMLKGNLVWFHHEWKWTCRRIMNLYGSHCLVIQGTHSLDEPLTYSMSP